MKKIYLDNRYGSGDGPKHDLSYDYLLFKQDWGGQESIFFNKEEVEDVCDKINKGEIIVDINSTIIYCKNEIRLNEIKNKFSCYERLMPEKA